MNQLSEVVAEANQSIAAQEERIEELLATREKEVVREKIIRLLEYLKSDDFWRPADLTVMMSETRNVQKARDKEIVQWIQALHKSSLNENVKEGEVDSWSKECSDHFASWSSMGTELLERLQSEKSTYPLDSPETSGSPI